MGHGVHHGGLADLVAVQFPHSLAVAQHEHTVGPLHDLLDLGGDHQHAEAALGKPNAAQRLADLVDRISGDAA